MPAGEWLRQWYYIIDTTQLIIDTSYYIIWYYIRVNLPCWMESGWDNLISELCLGTRSANARHCAEKKSNHEPRNDKLMKEIYFRSANIAICHWTNGWYSIKKLNSIDDMFSTWIKEQRWVNTQISAYCHLGQAVHTIHFSKRRQIYLNLILANFEKILHLIYNIYIYIYI